MMRSAFGFYLLLLPPQPAFAGPPYVSDDPEPTDYKHFEIYAYTSGTNTLNGTDGETGIDFNYGAAPDVQTPQRRYHLASVFRAVAQDSLASAMLNWRQSIAFCTKRISVGMSPSSHGFFCQALPLSVGDPGASVLLPIWAQRDLGNGWITFGGGGCQQPCTVVLGQLHGRMGAKRDKSCRI